MNWKLPSWLTIKIKPLLRRRPKQPQPPWLRRLNRFIALLIGLALVLFVVWRVLLYREIEQRFAAIRAAGLPASGQELNAWQTQVPEAENGALVLTQAFALCRTFPDSRSNLVVEPELLKRTNQWSAETRELISTYVLTNTAALAKAREAMQFQHFRFAADFSYGPETELPHLGELKRISRLIALQAALSAETGSPNEWPDQTIVLLRLAATIDEEPSLISHLVHNSMVREAAGVVERCLNQTVLPGDEAYQRLQAAFLHLGETNRLAHALIGERAMLVPAFRFSWSEFKNISRDDATGGNPRPPQKYLGKPMFALWLTGVLERDLNYFLRKMDQGISLAQLSPPGFLAMTNQLQYAGEVAHTNFYFLSAMVLPAFASGARREAATQAQIELAATGLAVVRFHTALEKWPGSLNELVPQFLNAVPADPFNGQPLHFRPLENGGIIYSVGADGKDDGGREPPSPHKSTDTNSYDLTFTIQR